MTTVQRPDAHIYDRGILDEIREDFDIILSSEKLREDPTFWDPRVGLDDAAAGVGGALTTELVARMLEARARRASSSATDAENARLAYEQHLEDELAKDRAVKRAQQDLRSAQDAESRARTALEEAQKAEAEARNAWNEDAQTKLNQTEDAITQKNKAIENAERIHEAAKIPVVDQAAVDAKASELAEAQRNLENLQKGAVDAEAVRNAEAEVARLQEEVSKLPSRNLSQLEARSTAVNTALEMLKKGNSVDWQLTEEQASRLSGKRGRARLTELNRIAEELNENSRGRIKVTADYRISQNSSGRYTLFEYAVEGNPPRIVQKINSQLDNPARLEAALQAEHAECARVRDLVIKRNTLERQLTEAQRNLENLKRGAVDAEAVRNAEAKVARLSGELETLKKGTVDAEAVRNAEARVKELKGERATLEAERTRLNELKTNAEVAAERTRTAAADLETAKNNVAECETRAKTATDAVRTRVRAAYSPDELRKIDSASRGSKANPAEVSKWGSRGLKIGGRMLGGLAVGLFLYHCYEYATDDPQFMKIDEEGQKILVDPKALSGADASKKQVLFQGENDRIATFMAMYAAEYGLAGVQQADWANYLVNMGTGQVFTVDSEVELRCTLLRAYQDMSDEEKIRFCDYLIAKNQGNSAHVAALQNLKAGLQNSGNGNVRPADTRTSTPTPATPTGNVVPRPAVTSPQTDNVVPRPAVTSPQPGSGRRQMKIPYSVGVAPASRTSVAPASGASVAPTADATRGLARAQRITDEGAEVDLTRTGGNSRNA